MNVPLTYSPEVQSARADRRPLVALESTIITHGMPYPQNVETARRVEAHVRAAGAVPATIAVMNGKIHIGLSDSELESLGRAQGAMKLSRADLAACVSTRRTGATTVAATMICARLAGIDVFATGGIGGVHRGAETSFDISADLREFAESAVSVVSAGAKAILDLPKTLEVLETLGVPVIAVGQDEFPGFWSRSSGLAAPLRLDTPAEIAAAHLMRGRLGLPGGQLVANPIPANAEIPRDVITPFIEQALAEAARKKNRREGRHAVSPATPLRADRRPLARREHRARAEQRAPRRADRDGDRPAARLTRVRWTTRSGRHAGRQKIPSTAAGSRSASDRLAPVQPNVTESDRLA